VASGVAEGSGSASGGVAGVLLVATGAIVGCAVTGRPCGADREPRVAVGVGAEDATGAVGVGEIAGCDTVGCGWGGLTVGRATGLSASTGPATGAGAGEGCGGNLKSSTDPGVWAEAVTAQRASAMASAMQETCLRALVAMRLCGKSFMSPAFPIRSVG